MSEEEVKVEETVTVTTAKDLSVLNVTAIAAICV